MKQEEALEILTSGKNVFLTGKAGTGKSWLTTKFIEQSKELGKNVIITAPTGIAAININGATIHSTFKMYGTYLYKKPIKSQLVNWKEIDIIIIDEISMVGPDFLDYIDYLLRQECGNQKPFGGIQIILVGDKAQLPPVYTAFTDTEKEEIEGLKMKYGKLMFDKALSFKGFEICELTEVKRQNDEKFISLLNELRDGNMQVLNQLKQGQYADDDYIHLKPFNTMVDKHNNIQLSKIPEEPEYFDAFVTGDFKEKDSITPFKLVLKKGCRVMITKNMPEEGLVNGDLGRIVSFGNNYITFYSDRLDEEIDIVRQKWKKIVYQGTEEVEIGSMTQYPFKLAYAITIHKSQGLSLDKVHVTIPKNNAKESTYVAISRATNMENLIINQL